MIERPRLPSTETVLSESRGSLDPETLDPETSGIEPEPLAEEPPPRFGQLDIGDRVGPYRIEALLGRGGMGVVYRAVREDDFEQRVALKLIGVGLPTTEVLERFYRERQILAELEHPNIARLLDGGTTPQALPYFAMEYVDGQPIDAWCEAEGLGLRRRLELFQQVCSAIEHAHRRLVVHRDLKPGNVLVTDDGQPKVLDFGIAKLLQGDPGDPVEGLTEAGHHPMTPAYASPEQFQGRPVTTASDVYSLGLLLYRLLTGRMPYELGGKDLGEKLQLICITLPSAPSQVAELSGVVGRAHDPTERRRWRRRLAGDLDSIVLEALHKEPEGRYGSVAELSADIGRYLEGLPVLARRGSWLYRTGKLVRRHTWAAVVLLLILVSAFTSTVLWRRAVHEREWAEMAAQRAEVEATKAIAERAVAERQRQRAESVSDFLEELFVSADPDHSRGAMVPVREILDRGLEKIHGELEDEPELRADLSGTLGSVYNNLGLYPEARVLKEEALRLRRASDLGDRSELAIDLNNLARFHYDLGDYAGAEPLFRQAQAMFERLGDAESSTTTLLNLALTLTHRGEREEALMLHRQVLAKRRQLLGDDHPKVASSLHSLAILHYTRGDATAAEPLLRQALGLYRRHHGAEHTRVASALANLGQVLHELERRDEAHAMLEDALELRLALLGPEHPLVANVRKSLAALLLDAGRHEQAEPLIEAALDTLRAHKPADDWTLADAEGVWGAYLLAAGRLEEAGPVLEASYRLLLRVKGAGDLSTRKARERLERFESLAVSGGVDGRD